MNLTIAKAASSYSRYKYRGCHHCVTLLNTWAGEGIIIYLPCLYLSPLHNSRAWSILLWTVLCLLDMSMSRLPKRSLLDPVCESFCNSGFQGSIGNCNCGYIMFSKRFSCTKINVWYVSKGFLKVCSKHPILWWGLWWWWHHYEVWVWCHRRSRSGGVDKWGDYRCTGYTWKDQE